MVITSLRELESIIRNKILPLIRLDMINASLFLSLSLSLPVGNRHACRGSFLKAEAAG